NHERRALVELVLELASEPHTTRGLCLTVQHGEVHTARIELHEHFTDTARLNVAHLPDVGGRPTTNGVRHGLAHLGSVAVNQNPQRLVGHRGCLLGGIVHFTCGVGDVDT